MAYNTKKGTQHTGDIQFEGDPNDTQIDFENDSITLMTGGAPRLVTNNSHVSASLAVSGATFHTLNTVINTTHISSSLNISGSKFYGDGSTLSGVGAGTMSSFTLRGDGGSTDSIGNANTIDIEGGTGITTANARSVTTNTLRVDLDNTAVSAGDYTYSSFTVDAQGRLTDASSGVAPAILSYTNPAVNRVVVGTATSTTVNAAAGLTFNGSKLAATGHISASLGVTGSLILATGSAAGVAVGVKSPVTSNMLYVSTIGNDNRVPVFITDSAENTLFAVTGSGKVIVGGKGPPSLDAKFNISGAATERLISLRSDTKSPVFYVHGDEGVYSSGSVTVKSIEPSMHFSSSTTAASHAIMGMNSTDNILIQNNSLNKYIVFKANDGGTIKEGLRIGGANPEVVVNQGADAYINFRVESENNDHMLFVTGSDQVGIGVSDPAIGVTLDISGSAIRLRNSSTPASAGAPGVPGEIRWDASYIYVCIAIDTWRRAAIAVW